MKILNSKEAFEAMMAGRNIMCRAVGELMDFDDLDRFPATIFAMPGYEFCIKVETMELAGITFTKPLTLDDVVEGQEIFLVFPHCVVHTQFTSLSGKYVESVRYGFAQADQKNAELQLQAIGKLLGRDIPYPLTIESHYKPEKKRRSRKAKEDTEQPGIPAGPNNAVPDIEKQPEPEVVQPIEITVQEAIVNIEAPVTETEEDSVETNSIKLVEKFTAQIDQFTNPDDVLSFRHVFLANGYLDQKGQQHLCKLTEDKLLELDPEQYMPKVELPSENLSVAELKILQEEAENLMSGKTQDASEEYHNLLNDLLDCASKATTPAEANSLVRYTRAWTEEQRKPLLEAIHKRLVQLNDANEQPSLAVRIQRAEDLMELDALEIDISSCDPVIQPRLMEMVEKRRSELYLLTYPVPGAS